MSIYQWSTTAGTNASADSNINWSEGQLPSTVNDSARAMMAALASMVRDQGGYATLGGSGNTFTLTLSQSMTSRVPALIGFFATRSNTGAVTMNVDSTGASPLRQVSGTDLISGQIVNGSFYICSWNSSTSEWIILNAANALLLTGGTMTGLLTLSGAPTTGLHAATKTYVDTVDARTVSAGTGLTGGGAISTNPTISIASGGVGTTQLASNAVTTVKITDSNVTTVKIADANVTAAKLDGAQTGSAPIFGARAWGQVANNGFTTTLTAGGNIASVSRVGTGAVTITFTTALPNANYAAIVQYDGNSGAIWTRAQTRATGSFQAQTLNTSATGQDANFSFIVVG